MNARRIFPLIALPLLAALPSAASAEVYSWKDASGKVHYGDRPPATQQGEARKLAAPPPVDADAARKAFLDSQMTEREKQKKTQEEAKKNQTSQADARAREENCQQARSTLAALESGQMRFTIGPNGERMGLDDAARNAEIARARQAVSNWCSAPPKQ